MTQAQFVRNECAKNDLCLTSVASGAFSAVSSAAGASAGGLVSMALSSDILLSALSLIFFSALAFAIFLDNFFSAISFSKKK